MTSDQVFSSGQGRRRELLRHAQDRAPAPRHLTDAPARPDRDLRLRGSLLQPPTAPLRPRLPQPRGVRGGRADGYSIGLSNPSIKPGQAQRESQHGCASMAAGVGNGRNDERHVPLVVVAGPEESAPLVDSVSAAAAVVYHTRAAAGWLRVPTSVAPDIIVLPGGFPHRMASLLQLHPTSGRAKIVWLQGQKMRAWNGTPGGRQHDERTWPLVNAPLSDPCSEATTQPA
jgi:hypothetical protein